jgi:hypothetical protein
MTFSSEDDIRGRKLQLQERINSGTASKRHGAVTH